MLLCSSCAIRASSTLSPQAICSVTFFLTRQARLPVQSVCSHLLLSEQADRDSMSRFTELLLILQAKISQIRSQQFFPQQCFFATALSLRRKQRQSRMQ